jgi:hypothetical protein
MVYVHNPHIPLKRSLLSKMKKRKSIRETRNMTQTALWLPRDMHEQLKKAGGERGLGEEIRRRLRMSFDEEDLRRNPTTRELLREIEQIALSMSLDDQWYANRFAFDVFKAAINELISSHQPRSDAPGTVAKLQAVYGPDEKPETIGRILARVFISQRGHHVEPTVMDWGFEYEGK